MGKVYLTGAGPGDIELLTVKALRVVKEADVIIYDHLANPDILKEAKSGCDFIYVGKEEGHHILPQDKINEVIYQNALKHDIVVRLKGGDPLVFGRGGEEAKYLREHGVDYEFIPGITSAISVPAYAGIPVTHRGVSVSFKVITGHEAPNKRNSQIDWQSLKSNGTIVFLMGLHNIKNIAKKLIEIGRDANTPVAVISRGTTKEQRVVVGNLGDIYDKVTLTKLPTPALIVVGDVVKFRKELKWFKSDKI